jgi:hypothetical protein
MMLGRTLPRSAYGYPASTKDMKTTHLFKSEYGAFEQVSNRRYMSVKKEEWGHCPGLVARRKIIHPFRAITCAVTSAHARRQHSTFFAPSCHQHISTITMGALLSLPLLAIPSMGTLMTFAASCCGAVRSSAHLHLGHS